jgi:hypothetical protein
MKALDLLLLKRTIFEHVSGFSTGRPFYPQFFGVYPQFYGENDSTKENQSHFSNTRYGGTFRIIFIVVLKRKTTPYTAPFSSAHSSRASSMLSR